MAEFKAVLSGDSFRFYASLLRQSREKLINKCERFIIELAEAGYNVVRAVLSENVETTQTIGSLDLNMIESGDGIFTATVSVESDAIMFLEFGSGLVGLFDGGSMHGGQFGMGPGTYPSTAKRQNPEYANWENPEGWIYIGEDGERHKSFGMAASMPMYRGGKEMEDRLQEIAMRVFGHA